MKDFSWDLKRSIERYGFRPVKLWENSKYEDWELVWPDGVVKWDSDSPPEPPKAMPTSDDVFLLDYELTE